ncbi:MAG TPA: hypothetical protein VN644_20405 [Pyrinomonadaceae bacterium]|jgi:hypothetical protein|nr:hypothetical protein [Pyrinomonadaceae bacterium]
MKALFPAALVLLMCFCVMAQAPAGDDATAGTANSLAEVRDMHNALLVVFKSRVLDVNDRERAIIQDVLKADPIPQGRYRWVYMQLASRLNKYIRKYKSLSAATELADADYVIYFNVVEFRRILYTYYPYGELFVIVKGSPEKLKPPRIVWRARKMLIADDAIGELIKDLKAARGET